MLFICITYRVWCGFYQFITRVQQLHAVGAYLVDIFSLLIYLLNSYIRNRSQT